MPRRGLVSLPVAMSRRSIVRAMGTMAMETTLVVHGCDYRVRSCESCTSGVAIGVGRCRAGQPSGGEKPKAESGGNEKVAHHVLLIL
jgi:hypothetical protein